MAGSLAFLLIALISLLGTSEVQTFPNEPTHSLKASNHNLNIIDDTLVASSDETFDEFIERMRNSSEPIRQYLEQCDRLVWQELPFAQAVTIPTVPTDDSNEGTDEGQKQSTEQAHYLYSALRFYLANRLMQARLFEEAKKVLEELIPENCMNPADVLMAKAVVFHHFSEKDLGLASLNAFQTFAEKGKVSRRVRELAKLLQFDWEQQEKEESPQQISRQMNDVRRRLGQGRTDEETQETEEGIMKSLDGLIEKIEEQAKKQAKQGEGQQSNTPAQESVPRSFKGPGNVDRKDFFQGDEWGYLPPKEREETLFKIEKEFPAYYRDIIEQYFREMAK